MAMSRAVARFELTRCVTKLRRFSFALATASCMADFVQQPVLDETLGQAAQGHASGAADRRYRVIIHGLKSNSRTSHGYYR